MIEEDRDEIKGILIVKDLLIYAFEPQRIFRLKEIMREPIYVPESKHLNDLLKIFRHTRQHMAVVVNEYGGAAGLVTIEDVIEQIVGDIEDEHDLVQEENIQSSSDRRFYY